MKAAVLVEVNKPMPIMELQQSKPKTGEVLVKMSAAGVCASDHHVMTGEAPMPMPIVLGHEGSGVVEEVGPGVTSINVGDKCILTFAPSCGFCQACRQGFSNMCDTNRITGTKQYDDTFRLHTNEGVEVHQMAKLGVFAEKIVIPQQSCFKVPDDFPMDVAALIGCSVTTGIGGVINQPNIKTGMSIAVFGVGGVGLNALQGARLLNASKIIAVDIHDHKLEFAYNFGATHIVNSQNEDPFEKINEIIPGGVDFAFDTFGHSITTGQAYNSTRKGGTTVVVGLAPAGMEASIPMIDIVRNQKTLVGSYYGSIAPHETFSKLLDLYSSNKIEIDSLVKRRYSLDQINEAYSDLAKGLDARGVIIF